MNYEAWRATFQSSEQAAQAAFEDARKHHEMLLNTLTRCNELDANLQRIIQAATAEGAGPLTQAAIKEMPAESLKELCVDQQQEGCLRVSEELRNGPIDWNKFGDDPREQAANVAILVGNQIRREAQTDLPKTKAETKQKPALVPQWKFDSLVDHCRLAEEERDKARERLALLNDDGAWHWMNDGEDKLESLTCLVLIPAADMRSLIADKQAEAVNEFAKEVWEEIFKHYRNVKVYPLTMAKQWIERRQSEGGA